MRNAALIFLSFASPGALFAQAAPAPFTTGFRYDAAGRLTGTIAPDPDGAGPLHFLAVRNTYDASGRLVQVETGELAAWQSEAMAPSAWPNFNVIRQVVTTFDVLDRKTSEIESSVSGGTTAVRSTQYNYDSAGNLFCSAVRMDPAQWAGQSNPCIPQTSGPNGPDRVTRRTYDLAGQLVKVQQAVGTSIARDYETYTYSANGKQTSVTDAKGNLSTFAYDGFDRLSIWTFPSPTAPGLVNANDYESYGYDPAGNRVSFRRRDGRSFTYAFDALNRIVTKFVPQGCAPIQIGQCPPAAATRNVYYGYDLRGLQESARFDSSSGDGITNTYDGFGRLIASTAVMSGTTRGTSYQYDNDGNRIRVNQPDGIYFQYTYDGMDRMVGAAYATPGAPVLTPFAAITFDTAGRRATLARPSSSTTYSYDGVSRLIGQQHLFGGGVGNLSEALTYNAASQVTTRARSVDDYTITMPAVSRTYTVNGLNQYQVAGPATFTWDANGNLVGDGTNSYGYDGENRLISSSTSQGTTLVYDPLGRLWQTSSGSLGVMQFLYEGDHVAVEYDGSAVVRRRFAWGSGADEPLLQDEGGAMSCVGTRFLVADYMGSLIAAADCAGNRQAAMAYDEYGIPRSGNWGRFQFTGQAWLPDLGMYYYKARIYSPTLGRFMQTDPVGYKDQNNLYTYVGNDPINRSDPTGEKFEYRGTTLEQQQLKAAIEQVAKTDSFFSARFDVMNKSDRTVIVSPTAAYPTEKAVPDPVKPSQFNLANQNTSVADARDNSSNGVGASSDVTINLKGVTLPGKGPNGSDLPANAADQAAHEVFEHSYQTVTGNQPIGKEANGDKVRETRAVPTENRFRERIPDAPLRQKY